MSMLAEKKRKSKLTLNPRGTLWSNDENKFGQKLLEKMGWSKGKGLGRHEQGMKTPIRVSGNSESKGIGFKGNNDLTNQHYQNYEDALAALNSINYPDGSNNESEKDSSFLKNVESLEVTSKNSRARIHYAKFTRAKDMSRWSEDDLACVLGSKKISQGKVKSKMSENQNETVKEEHEELSEKESTDKKENFTYGGNLNEYFNQKMKELKRKRGEGLLGDEQTPRKIKKDSSSPPGTPFPDLEFEPEKSTFSFNLSVQECDVKAKEEEEEKSKELHAEAEDNEIIDKKKKRKKSKKAKNIEKVESNSISLNEEKEGHYEIFEENENDTEIDVKKTKQKFKKDDVEENNSSEKESKKKKKKKEKRAKEEQCVSNSKSEEPLTKNNSESNIEYEVQPQTCDMNESYFKATSTSEKKKKKRKETSEEMMEDKENGSGTRHLKKLRKLTSEISLPEVLKSSSEKIENENNANCEVENGAEVKTVEEGKEKSNKVKLKSKKSFKELKTDFEAKVKEKFKKISKTELIPIKEEVNPEPAKTKGLETNTSKIINLEVPVGYDNGDYMHSDPKQYTTVQFDVQKTFPNSNLEQIKGYFKS